MNINRFIQFTLKHSVAIIVITLAVTVFMGFQAAQIGTDTNVNTLLPEQNARIEAIQKNLGVESETGKYVFTTIVGDNLFEAGTLEAFQDYIDGIMGIPEVESVLSPFNFIYFDSENRRIIPTTITDTGRVPETPEEIEAFARRMREYPLAQNFVTAENGTVLSAIFRTATVDETEKFIDVYETERALLKDRLQGKAEVYTTGEVPFQDRVGNLLGKDFSVLLALALVAMLSIFWLSFRSLRAVLLPTSVVLIGAVWTIGFMAMLGYRITIVSVIIPSLILTIGSSYSIHILNEYYRNTKVISKEDKRRWLADSVEHVFRTVVVAGLTTAISFLSLVVTTLAPLREFGLSISLGILFCTILALFFLPAVFYLLGVPKERARERINRGRLTKAVIRTGRWAAKRRYVIIGFLAALMAAFLFSYPRITHQSDYFSYFPSDDEIIQDTRVVNRYSGGSQAFNITINAPEGAEGYFLDPEVLKTVDLLETVLDENPNVVSRLSFNSILKTMNQAVNGSYTIPENKGLILLLSRYFKLIPADKVSVGGESSVINEDASNITIYLRMVEAESYNMISEDDIVDFLSILDKEVAKLFDESVEINYWGNTLLLLDASKAIKRDQFLSTFMSMMLGMVIMMFFFRSFTHSLLALVPLLSGIFFYFVTLYVFRIPLDMTTILVTNVTVGVGLDDAVHFILQYREQRKVQNYKQALAVSLRITGRPIVLTTLSLMAGLMVLCFASFKPIIYFGFLISGTLFSTMVGTVVFIPAIVAIAGKIRERSAG